MTTFEAASPQNGRESRIFHPGGTFGGCPKQGFSGVADSKTRDKSGFLRNFKLTGVKLPVPDQFLMPPHGPKCERGKKILKRWGFSGVRTRETEVFRADLLICFNISTFTSRPSLRQANSTRICPQQHSIPTAFHEEIYYLTKKHVGEACWRSMSGKSPS